jgi:hypothetical protein
VSPQGELGPPLPTPLTTSGGSDQNHSPSKIALPNFSKIIFFLFNTSSSKVDFGQMEMNFKKTREFFVQNRIKNKKIFHMFHRCHQLGEYKLYFNLIFSVSSFSCFSPDFAGPVSTSWRRIWRNERIFLYRT